MFRLRLKASGAILPDSFRKVGCDGYGRASSGLAQVRRLLGFATRLEAQEFLGRRGVAVFDFDPSELDREAKLIETIAARE